MAYDYEEMNNVLAVTELARLLHTHPNTLRRWSDNGRIEAHRITRWVAADSGARKFARSLANSTPKMTTREKQGSHADNEGELI